MLPSSVSLDLSGERFAVTYHLTGAEAEAYAKAKGICVEQTVEFPVELAPAGDIQSQVIGQLESWQPLAADRFEAVISYAVETAGTGLTQLLNVIFGNTSLQPGVRVERLELSPGLLQRFKGPRFGRAGLRILLDVPQRPLLSTALKPMGLSASDLAHLAYQCALGGIDIIKDDHGLANQAFAPYRERVEQCTAAVIRANQQTGYKSIYVPNVTAPVDQILDRAFFAKQAGAGGLLISPGLTGFDAMRHLAEADNLALPLLSHPAFLGSFVTNPTGGISHYALFGQIARLAGADATIYPNYGGRFSFNRIECQAIAAGAEVAMAHLKPIFPAPGGGMSLEAVPDMLQVYGREVIFLIGGGLYRHGPDLVENCRHFRRLVEQM